MVEVLTGTEEDGIQQPLAKNDSWCNRLRKEVGHDSAISRDDLGNCSIYPQPDRRLKERIVRPLKPSMKWGDSSVYINV